MKYIESVTESRPVGFLRDLIVEKSKYLWPDVWPIISFFVNLDWITIEIILLYRTNMLYVNVGFIKYLTSHSYTGDTF